MISKQIIELYLMFAHWDGFLSVEVDSFPFRVIVTPGKDLYKILNLPL